MEEALRVVLIIVGVIIVAGIYLWGRQRRVRLETERLFEEAVKGPTDPNDDWEIVPIRADRSPAPDADHLSNLSGIRGREAVAPVSEEVLEEVAPVREAFRDQPEPEPEVVTDPEPEPVLVAGESSAETGPDEALLEPEVAETTAALEDEVFALTVMAEEGAEFSGAALSEVFDDLGLLHGEMNLFHWHDPASGKPVLGVANVLEPGMFEAEIPPELATPGLVLFMRLPGPMSGVDAIDQFLATARRLARRLEGQVCDQARRPLDREADAEMRERAAPFAAPAVKRVAV